ncbi:MAG: hypothetical protein L6R00_21105 [Phycisphaerae bacterium]|nr:hypothetical protein [Phycisphaerae bacterium]
MSIAARRTLDLPRGQRPQDRLHRASRPGQANRNELASAKRYTGGTLENPTNPVYSRHFAYDYDPTLDMPRTPRVPERLRRVARQGPVGNRETYEVSQGPTTTYKSSELDRYTATADPSEYITHDANGNLSETLRNSDGIPWGHEVIDNGGGVTGACHLTGLVTIQKREVPLKSIQRGPHVPGDAGRASMHRPVLSRGSIKLVSIAGWLLILVASGCIVDVVTFAKRDISLRVINKSTAQPVQGAHVALTAASGEVLDVQFRSTTPTDSDGITSVEMIYGSCFRSILSLNLCEPDEESMLGMLLNVEVSTAGSTLNANLALSVDNSVSDGQLLVTIVDISSPQVVGIVRE